MQLLVALYCLRLLRRPTDYWKRCLPTIVNGQVNVQWLKKAAGIHEVDLIMSLSAQVLALANQIASFTTRDAASKESTMVASSSSYSRDDVGLDVEQCQFINNRNYNF